MLIAACQRPSARAAPVYRLELIDAEQLAGSSSTGLVRDGRLVIEDHGIVGLLTLRHGPPGRVGVVLTDCTVAACIASLGERFQLRGFRLYIDGRLAGEDFTWCRCCHHGLVDGRLAPE